MKKPFHSLNIESYSSKNCWIGFPKVPERSRLPDYWKKWKNLKTGVDKGDGLGL
jgi:hypothetical protein